MSEALGAIIGNLVHDAINVTNNTILGWANFGRQKKVADQNYTMQKKNYDLQKQAFDWNMMQTEWEKQQFQTMMQREDTAVQRRVEDLKAAGINPLLAAGQAAQASGPVSPNHVSAPEGPPQRTTPDMPMAQALQAFHLIKEYLSFEDQLKTSRFHRSLLGAQIRHTNAATNKEWELAEQERNNTLWSDYLNYDLEERYRLEYGNILNQLDTFLHDRPYLLKEGSPTWLNEMEGTTDHSRLLRDMGIDPNSDLGKLLNFVRYLFNMGTDIYRLTPRRR